MTGDVQGDSERWQRDIDEPDWISSRFVAAATALSHRPVQTDEAL